MDNKQYIDMLCERYGRYFNVHRDYELFGKNLDIFAEYNVKNQRYVLTKKAVIYSFDNFEYCLVKGFDGQVEEHQVEDFCEYIVSTIKEMVKPNPEHMSSMLSGVMVCERGFSQAAIQRAEKFKYSKDFMFTLKGWCDAALVLVDPVNDLIITNKKGKEVKKNYTVSISGQKAASK